MLNEADLRDGAAEADALPVEGASDTPRTSRRLLLGGSLAALGLAAGNLVRPSAAVAQGTPAAAPPKGPQFLRLSPARPRASSCSATARSSPRHPQHLLDDDTTPIEKFFVRNNGQTPDPFTEGDAWELKIDGEVNTPLKLKLGELKQKFTPQDLPDGAGMRRQRPLLLHSRQARGNQWTNGGAGCAEWTGVRARRRAEERRHLKASAKFTPAITAPIQHLSGDTTKDADLARHADRRRRWSRIALIVWAMNGQPLPAYPWRAAAGRWSPAGRPRFRING
jgi:sulfite oxidase